MVVLVDAVLVVGVVVLSDGARRSRSGGRWRRGAQSGFVDAVVTVVGAVVVSGGARRRRGGQWCCSSTSWCWSSVLWWSVVVLGGVVVVGGVAVDVAVTKYRGGNCRRRGAWR